MLVGYARVSTKDQTTDMQREALTKAGCERIFEETASGAKADRPQLKAALDYLRTGDTLVVWRFDRLARSLRQLVETVEDLEHRGIRFRSLKEEIDTSTPNGKLIFHIFASLAEFERGLIRERVLAGLEIARSKGKHMGRPAKLTDTDIRAAKAMLADPELSAKEVAERLGVSLATLYRHIPAAKSLAEIG